MAAEPRVHRSSKIDTSISSELVISIVIPVFNREGLISEAIESALSQDYPYVDIVVCDNASSDNTLSACLEYARLHSNITVASQPFNRGPVANWLACVTLAKGDMIKFLFSDDILMPSCLREMSRYLQPGCGLVYSPCLVGNNQDDCVVLYNLSLNESSLSTRCALVDYALLRRLPLSPCAALFRRSDVISSLTNSIRNPVSEESVNTGAGPDVRVFLDTLLNYEFIASTSHPLIFLRAHKGSFTTGPTRRLVIHGYQKTFREFYARISLLLYIGTYAQPLLSYLAMIASSFYRSWIRSLRP